MATSPKFVQITSAAVVTGNNAQLVLHALDESGQVWQWSAQNQQWLALPEERFQQQGA
jgi:hypothetical protein